MYGLVARAGHFLSHPFGLHPIGPAEAAPSAAKSDVTPILPAPARAGADADLSWLGLARTGPEAANPRDELTWLSLETDERDDPRGEMAWLGLEEV